MNNSNNENNTMNDNTMNNSTHSSSTILIAEAVLKTPPQKQPGTSALYKLAARNLREYHGVPSMTALKLEKTVALLGLAPRRIVVQGLAPRRLLTCGKGGLSPLILAGEISDESKEELREVETGAVRDDNLIDIDNNNSSSSEDLEEEEEKLGQEDLLFSDDSNSTYDDNGDGIDNIVHDPKGDAEGLKADGNGNDKTRRPIHAALVAGGINLRPRETRPLLLALGVSPHRLVKLGLVKREAARTMPGRRGGGPGQHVRADGLRKAGMGGRKAGMEGRKAGTGGPRGPVHRGPRHQGGRLQGPPHGPGRHSMPTGRHGRGPPGGGGGKHGHGHGHDGGGLQHGESEEEGGQRLHGGARGPGQNGSRRHGGGGVGRCGGHPHGPVHGLFQEGASGALPGMMAHPQHGSPSGGGGGLKKRGARHGGGTGFCGGGMQQRRRVYLAHFDGRHQPQLEAY
ncbi:unnamed protein product [Laminaria digitata]